MTAAQNPAIAAGSAQSNVSECRRMATALGPRTEELLPTAVALPVTRAVAGVPPVTTLPPTLAVADPELVMTRPGGSSPTDPVPEPPPA